jgi:hypothetical protein
VVLSADKGHNNVTERPIYILRACSRCRMLIPSGRSLSKRLFTAVKKVLRAAPGYFAASNALNCASLRSLMIAI